MEKLTFKQLNQGCTGGKCPTIYEGSDGNIYIKGYIVTNSVKRELEVISGEGIVQVPKEIFKNIFLDNHESD